MILAEGAVLAWVVIYCCILAVIIAFFMGADTRRR